MTLARAQRLTPPFADADEWRALPWREKLRAYLRPPRRLAFTRAGKWFFWITLGVGAAAVNSGNNPLYLVLGAQLAVIVVSGFLSEAVLRGLEIERRLVARGVAGQPLLVEFRVTNRKRRAASYSLILRDLIDGPGAPARSRKNRWVGPEAHLLRVGPGETAVARYRITPPRRGEYAIRRLLVATRFPFGLFEKWREYVGPATILVAPAPRLAGLPRVPRHTRSGEQPVGVLGRGGEVYGLRDFRPGDDPRALAQKASARRDRPVVREFEAERARRVEIAVDNRRAPSAPPPDLVAADAAAPDRLPHATDPLDELTGRAAGLARRLVGERTTVALAAHGARVPPGDGVGHLEEVFAALARLEPAAPGPAPAVLDPAAERVLLQPAATPDRRATGARR